MDRAVAAQAVPLEARVAGRLTVGFMIDVSEIGRDGEPLLSSMLLAAIIHANVSYLNHDPELQLAYARLDSVPPDALRRPVSINALAGSLRLPFETVRRHVKALVERGLLTSTPSGVVAPIELLVSPHYLSAVRDRYVRVFRLYDDVREGGVVEPLPSPPLPVDDPRAPVRAVGRILSDYFFRTLDGLHRSVPDPLTALVLLAIVRANTEHLAAPEALDLMRSGWIDESERVPARVAELSRSLGIPYETTRRHVAWLAERGMCRREGAGYLTSSRLEIANLPANAVANLTNLRRMFRQIGAVATGAEAAAGGGAATT